MYVDLGKQDIDGVKELLKENGEDIEDLGLTDENILHMLEEGY